MMLLPPPDVSQAEVRLRLIREGYDHDRTSEIIRAQYSDNQLKKYITAFFEIFFVEYRGLIESCFPTLKDSIPFYANLPAGVCVEIIDSEFGAEIRCGYKYSNTEPKIDIVINPPEAHDPFSEDERFRSWQVKRLSSIFLASQPVPYSGLNDSSAGECPLRNYIYETIFTDMEVILQAVAGLN